MKALQGLVDAMRRQGMRVKVMQDVKMMARHILEADIVITSNGRTVYEVTAIGTPCISISQNERESRHLFVKVCDGILDLGLAIHLTQEKLAEAIDQLIRNFRMRRRMNRSMLQFDLRGGTDRTLRLIWRRYEEFCTSRPETGKCKNSPFHL